MLGVRLSNDVRAQQRPRVMRAPAWVDRLVAMYPGPSLRLNGLIAAVLPTTASHADTIARVPRTGEAARPMHVSLLDAWAHRSRTANHCSTSRLRSLGGCTWKFRRSPPRSRRRSIISARASVHQDVDGN